MRLMLGIALMLVLVLALTAVAQAATPQDIYNDYAEDSQLDGTYTDVELEAYLNDAVVHQYGNSSIIDELDRLVKDTLATEERRSTFPFTGSVLAISAALALALICGGIVLRRGAAD